MFGKIDYGWVLDVLVIWLAFRLLLTLVRGLRDGATLGRNASVVRVMILCPMISGIVFGLLFCVTWHWIFPKINPILVTLLYVVSFLVGFIGGMIFDFTLAIAFERLVGVRFVSLRKAAFVRELQIGEMSERVRAASALAYLAQNARDALPQAIDAMRSDLEPDVRAMAARAVLSMDSAEPEVVPAAQLALRDADVRVRCLAACILVQRKVADPAIAVPALVAALTCDDDAVVSIAVYNLRNLGPEAAPAIPDLIRLLGSRTMSLAAEDALQQIGEPAVPALAEHVRRGETEGRIAAARALAFLAEKARPAIPALSEAIQDPEPRLREAAQEALRDIESGQRSAGAEAGL